jgi:uncharacterized membrane protein YdjX (TVP38/TMEM64 family)
LRAVLRLWPILLIAALLAAAVLSGATRYLSFEALQKNEQALRDVVEANRWAAIAAFVGVYALATAASAPGAIFLTLAGGFLFGTWIGGSATAVGATIGAVALWAAVNTALGEPLRRKAESDGGRLKQVIEGVRRDAFSYVLTLRLLPIAPFWLVNAAAGLAGAPLGAYTLATFLGILPATFIYSAIGAGLGELFARGETPDLGVIFEPFVLGPLVGLALLSLTPVVWKRVRRRKEAA